MDNYYKIGEFSNVIGVSKSTLRRWDVEGKLKPAQITCGGTRLYSEKQIPVETENKIVLAYSVDNLDELKSYLEDIGDLFKIESSLQNMLNMIHNNKVSNLVFYNLNDIRVKNNPIDATALYILDEVCKLHNVKIIILEG